MSITRRLFDLARSNITDFGAAFRKGDALEGLSEEERKSIDDEVAKETVGAKAGRGARRVRDAAEEAWERAFEAAQARAEAGGGAPTRRHHSEADRLRWYRTLELQPGATLEEVRKSYRRLLKQYHPDRFNRDPEKHRVATEVTRNITEAYERITELLEAG